MTEHPVQEFISELYHQDEDVRRAAAQLLGIDPETGVEAFLGKALSSPDAPVRAAAARALGELEARESVSSLIEALSDPDDATRASAASNSKDGDG